VKTRTLSTSFLLLLVAVFAVLLMTGQASAHGGRHIAGKYTFMVGFLEEPTYAQMKNGLDLTICNGEECEYTVKDGLRVVTSPVENAHMTLKAEVVTGSAQPQALTLEPRFNNPGKYAAYFVPTKEGAYTFRIFGTLGGTKIDEKFTSGKDKFNEVEAPIAYPALSSAEQNAPSSGQGGNNTIATITALQEQVKAAESAANNATTFGIAGIVLGIIGVALAGFTLTRKGTGAKEASASSAQDLRG
jgi:hypothetical protein